MKQILLLGGSGILGREVQKILEIHNCNFQAPSSLQLDLRNENSTERYISSFKPDWIINCAAWTQVDEAEFNFQDACKLNQIAVENLGKIAKCLNSKIIHISSDYVFDGDSSIPYSEISKVNPINGYGKSKLLGELGLLTTLSSAFVIRTSWLYSSTGKNFVKTMAKNALQSNSVAVVDDQIGSPTNAIDLAMGVYEIMRKVPQWGIYHYSNLGSCSWFEFAKEIYSTLGADTKKVVPISTSTLNLPAQRPKYSVLSKEKWNLANISSLKDWKESLHSSLPEIVSKLG